MNLLAKNIGRIQILALILVTTASVQVTAQTQPEESQSTVRSITGQVITEAGQPIANASIFLRGSIPVFQPRTILTDNDGKFQVNGLGPALYAITATAPSYVSPPRDPESTPTYYRLGESVTLNLIKGGVITGMVTTSSGEPVVQVSVSAVLVRDVNGEAPRHSNFQRMGATDDRGIYRIYGLTPGTYVVSAGGRSFGGPFAAAYDRDAQTYAPSSSRDTAAEIAVRAGEETSGVDIRYRGEPGHVVSGLVTGPIDSDSRASINVALTQIINGSPTGRNSSFQPPNSKGFAFYGVGDGDYDLNAQLFLASGEMLIVYPRRLTVRNSDITGLELSLKPLGTIEGRVALEKSAAPECKNKREPLFFETLVLARRNNKNVLKDQPRFLGSYEAQGSPNKNGDFQLRNLAPGEFNLTARFFAKYWYLRSISRATSPGASPPPRTAPAPRQIDAARTGLGLKFGERITGLTITLSEGAASLSGSIKLLPGQTVPPRLYVHLVPAEKEHTEEVLRFFSATVNADGTFALYNLPPGRYWAVSRVAADNESLLDSKLRLPDETERRAVIRRSAELANTAVEFNPCQNITDYQLPLASAAPKN